MRRRGFQAASRTLGPACTCRFARFRVCPSASGVRSRHNADLALAELRCAPAQVENPSICGRLCRLVGFVNPAFRGTKGPMFFKSDDGKPGPKKRIVPLLPLRDIIVFPHMVSQLFVGRERSINALDAAMARDKDIFLAAQKNAKTN